MTEAESNPTPVPETEIPEEAPPADGAPAPAEPAAELPAVMRPTVILRVILMFFGVPQVWSAIKSMIRHALGRLSPDEADEIAGAFNHWDDIDVHFKGRTITSGGHGFCGIGRKRLLNILQARCEELGVRLVFETNVSDERAVAAAHGADLVLHSATKGIAGHNDASLGVVCGSLAATGSSAPGPASDLLKGGAKFEAVVKEFFNSRAGGPFKLESSAQSLPRTGPNASVSSRLMAREVGLGVGHGHIGCR